MFLVHGDGRIGAHIDRFLNFLIDYTTKIRENLQQNRPTVIHFSKEDIPDLAKQFTTDTIDVLGVTRYVMSRICPILKEILVNMTFEKNHYEISTLFSKSFESHERMLVFSPSDPLTSTPLTPMITTLLNYAKDFGIEVDIVPQYAYEVVAHLRLLKHILSNPAFLRLKNDFQLSRFFAKQFSFDGTKPTFRNYWIDKRLKELDGKQPLPRVPQEKMTRLKTERMQIVVGEWEALEESVKKTAKEEWDSNFAAPIDPSTDFVSQIEEHNAHYMQAYKKYDLDDIADLTTCYPGLLIFSECMQAQWGNAVLRVEPSPHSLFSIEEDQSIGLDQASVEKRGKALRRRRRHGIFAHARCKIQNDCCW